MNVTLDTSSKFYKEHFVLLTIQLLATNAILVNILCAHVLSFKEFKKPIYKYLMINSVVDAIVLTLLSTISASNSSLVISYFGRHFVISFRRYIGVYCAKSFTMISSFINIKIAYDRCAFLVQYRNGTIKAKQRVGRTIAVFSLTSFLYSMPSLVFLEMEMRQENYDSIQIGDLNYFTINGASTSISIKTLLKLNNGLPFAICFLLMIVLTSVLIRNARKKFQHKYQLIKLTIHDFTSRDNFYYQQSQHRRMLHESMRNEKKVNIMVILISISYVVQQLFFMITGYLYASFDLNSRLHVFITFILSFVCMLCYCSNILIYYKFDKTFKKRLKMVVF